MLGTYLQMLCQCTYGLKLTAGYHKQTLLADGTAPSYYTGLTWFRPELQTTYFAFHRPSLP